MKSGGPAESGQVEAGTIMVVLYPEIADVGSWSQIVDGFFFHAKMAVVYLFMSARCPSACFLTVKTMSKTT